MKVLVPIKRVIDPYVKIQVRANGTGVETAHTKMTINPFDEIALEEALRWKEQGHCEEVLVISIGDKSAEEQLRTALAMGADRAELIETDTIVEPLHVAQILADRVQQENIEVVIMGKQAIDDDANQTGQMLAALLNWPQATFASKVVWKGKQALVVREIDGGLETVSAEAPLVITTDLRLNEPRYPTLPNIMKARKKPLVSTLLDSLKIDREPHTRLLSVKEPLARTGGRMVSSVDELLTLLRDQEQVIE